MGREAEFERALLAVLVGAGRIVPGARILVAVSGGADSCALLAGLVALGERHDFPLRLGVAHIDHGLRGAASRQDAQFVADLAASFGLPFFLAEVRLGTTRANLEERARDARLAALRGIAGAWRASAIALGHTRDDQAETFLMRLARGAGVASLGAMEVRRADGLLRPLLLQSRAAGRAYLGSRGLAWSEDESNSSPAFFRNRVRHELMPVLDRVLGVDAGARLARLAEELRVESELAAAEIARQLGADALRLGQGARAATSGAALSIAALQSAGPAAGRLLHAWITEAGIRLSARQVAQALGLAGAERPSGEVALVGGWRLRRRYAALHLIEPHEVARLARLADGWKEVVLPVPSVHELPNGMRLAAAIGGALMPRTDLPAPSPPASYDPSVGGAELRFSHAHFPAPLVARPLRPGDRIALRGGHRKLADLLVDRRVPRDLRPGLIVVASGAEILWVPGVAANRRALVSGGGEIVVLTCVSQQACPQELPD
ncbi:MAG: tRNA lysidine(34) synthetase TilS [Deltaproteobacteria bacterium]